MRVKVMGVKKNVKVYLGSNSPARELKTFHTRGPFAIVDTQKEANNLYVSSKPDQRVWVIHIKTGLSLFKCSSTIRANHFINCILEYYPKLCWNFGEFGQHGSKGLVPIHREKLVEAIRSAKKITIRVFDKSR